ncbi:MAG TPA: TetR/AcrR family transcriptional regulator [Roseiflexaceae bacterium]|nr:TetR/AcrR family transcriptional regulator [Roseiflexaceae bacterium]
MARAKSQDKRNALLDAAIAVFAQRGIGSTPTIAISRAAGVAEGTLFTYFPTKEALVNELYLALKRELADALLAPLPETADTRTAFSLLWERYIRWGVANPEKFKVLTQFDHSDHVSAESHAIGKAPFAELDRLIAAAFQSQEIGGYPFPFLGAVLQSLAETTIAFVAQQGDDGVDYTSIGFAIFWNGIKR